METNNSKTSKRIILFTGKGGVGKTSVAAATALRCSKLGYKTIVLSTDTAHSLADSFEFDLAPEPVEIAKNLWGQEVDVYYSIQKYWGKLQKYMAAVFTWRGVENIMAEEIAALPGMEEGSGLLWIEDHYHNADYDIIIVDCAPTAETLRLLSLPDTGRWWFEKLFPIGKRATLMFGPIARPLLDDMPMPDEDILDEAEVLFNRLDKLHQLLIDPDLSSMRLVVTPEKMVIKEAQRSFTYLNLYGYITDAIVCNRIFPSGEGYFSDWKEIQDKYLELIDDSFKPLPILTAPYFSHEVLGLERLDELANHLYGELDPSEILFHGKGHEILQIDDGYILSIPLPFATKEEISLFRNNDELSIQAGSWRRNLILPRALLDHEITRAKFESSALNIYFIHTPEEG